MSERVKIAICDRCRRPLSSTAQDYCLCEPEDFGIDYIEDQTYSMVEVIPTDSPQVLSPEEAWWLATADPRGLAVIDRLAEWAEERK